jgi:predicted  nucleic acid-binding Zn-ribbon protein
LPAQMKTVVRRAEEIIICESCGAIIVWDDESA